MEAKLLQMGLGDALLRSNFLQSKINAGVASDVERKEYKLLLEALNELKIDVGFDCDNDGVPDTIDIFAESSKTDCCALIPVEIERISRPKVESARKRPKTTSARGKK